MTVPPEPGDYNRPDWSDEDQRLRASMASELPSRQSLIDREDFLQADPVMVEGEASYARIAVYAVAALLVMCVVLYGMGNNRGNTTASYPQATADKMAANPAPPVRNVTPGPTTQSGTTTGAASSTPAQAPSPGLTAPGAMTR